MKELNKDLSINIYFGIIWLISVLSFLQIISINLYFLLVILGVTKFLILIFRTYLFSNLLVYLIILAPIFGAIRIFNINLLFSDIFLAFTIIILLLKNKYPYNSTFFYFVFTLIFFHFIIHFILGDLIYIKPLISIIEIFSIYYTSKETLKDQKNTTIFISIILSTLIGILLMFLAFYKGINLNDFEGDNKALIKDALELDISNYRMSYFYTNFPFIISSTIFILLFYLGRYENKIIKIALISLILIICLSLVTSGNKTVMFTTFIIYLFSNIFFNNKGIYKLKNILYLFFFVLILNKVIFSFFLNDLNSELFTKRMLSSDSFEDRLGVYTNVIHIFSNNLSRIFLGYGADFLAGGGDSNIANSFKINYYTKNEQGAVDSGIITFFIEFGLLYFVLFTYVIFKRIKYLYANLNPTNIVFLQIFSIFIISSFTQIIGLSKIFWFFVLIFVLTKNSHKNSSILIT